MTSIADYLPSSHILKASPKTFVKSLYLITIIFTETRKIITQDWLGETAPEITQKLRSMAFNMSELTELLEGLPVETKDGKKQYYISDVKLEPKQLGSFRLKR